MMLEATCTIAVGDREEWGDGRGTTVIYRPALRVVHFRTRGYLSDELEYFGRTRNEAVLDELAARGGNPALQGFYDWQEMTGYSTGARAQSTSFTLARRKQFAAICILFKSPMVALAINVANLLMGGFVKGTTSREEFEARLQRALGDGPVLHP